MASLELVSLATLLLVRRTENLPWLGVDRVALCSCFGKVGASLNADGLRQLPPSDLEALTSSLENCLGALNASAYHFSPAAVLLMSGPLLRRLRPAMWGVAAALASLSTAVSAAATSAPRPPQEATGDGAGPDPGSSPGASGPAGGGAGMGASYAAAMLRDAGEAVAAAPLALLEAQAEACAELQRRLVAAAGLHETGAAAVVAEAAAEAAVREALTAAGVPLGQLRDPESRSELIAELFDLAQPPAVVADGGGSSRNPPPSPPSPSFSAAAAPLVTAADGALIAAVASALLYTPTADEMSIAAATASAATSVATSAAAASLDGAMAAAAARAEATSAAWVASAAAQMSTGRPTPPHATPTPPPPASAGAPQLSLSPQQSLMGGVPTATLPAANVNTNVNANANAAANAQTSQPAAAAAPAVAPAADAAAAAATAADASLAAAAPPAPPAPPAPAAPPRLRRPPLQRSLLCPITQMLMRDPVTTAAGHTYERCAIEAWFRNNGTDPQTRQTLPSRVLTPCWAVKGAIDEWLAAAGMTHDEFDDAADTNYTNGQPYNSGAAAADDGGGSSGGGGGGGGSGGGGGGDDGAAAAAAVPRGSPAYTTFAHMTQWYQVTDVDAEAKTHLKAAGVTPAVARALTEILGNVTMADLREGAVEEAHVALLGLKPLDQRRLLAALVAAAAGGAGGAAVEAASSSAAAATAAAARRPAARLLDYVTVTPGHAAELDAEDGPLSRGTYGIVVMDDRSDDKPLRVRSLQEPYRVWWYTRAALQPVPPTAVPAALRLELPADEENMGTPVTPFCSEPGMLVRRGYDWLNNADQQGLSGEVGMLVNSTQGGLMWRVFWANGGEGIYHTGRDEKYELQHLQVHPFSGAPVVDDVTVVAGCGVVRGLHWTWDNQDGGPGAIGSVQMDERTGFVAALWPNHRLARYRASTAQGFDLNYCSRPGEPVTLYNAQAGLKVTRGRDWKWEAQDGEGSVGVLLRPSLCTEGGVWWQVAWASGSRNQYRVGRPGSEWCDLQVATYESSSDTGRLLPGTPVLLSVDYGRFTDAKEGPLRPGKVGVVVSIGGGEARFKVMHLRTSAQWWYDRAALRPLPGRLAAERSRRMRLNREGRAAFLGSSGGGTGGDTGKAPREVFYCGASLGQCRCGACDGRCGPDNGCPCHACAELIGKHVTLEGSLADSGAVDAGALLALLALASREED